MKEASFELHESEVLGLVGESGSGKSTLARALAGLLAPSAGQMRWEGAPLPPTAGRRTRQQVQEIQIIFQSPDSSLNPRRTVGEIIARAVALLRPDVAREDRQGVVDKALGEVRLDPAMRERYPHELSGGQKQRVAIARAFVVQPRFVICDEIVTGQDVSVQAAILELIRGMQEERGTALLFISHDLAVVRSVADRVAVMQRGLLVEQGSTEQVFVHPQHSYTQQLLQASSQTLTTD